MPPAWSAARQGTNDGSVQAINEELRKLQQEATQLERKVNEAQHAHDQQIAAVQNAEQVVELARVRRDGVSQVLSRLCCSCLQLGSMAVISEAARVHNADQCSMCGDTDLNRPLLLPTSMVEDPRIQMLTEQVQQMVQEMQAQARRPQEGQFFTFLAASSVSSATAAAIQAELREVMISFSQDPSMEMVANKGDRRGGMAAMLNANRGALPLWNLPAAQASGARNKAARVRSSLENANGLALAKLQHIRARLNLETARQVQGADKLQHLRRRLEEKRTEIEQKSRELQQARERQQELERAAAAADLRAAQERAAALGVEDPVAAQPEASARRPFPAGKGSRPAHDCAICFARPKNTALNCGHQLCDSCAGQVAVCPICRGHITTRIRLYDS